jgi:hypothetical protein
MVFLQVVQRRCRYTWTQTAGPTVTLTNGSSGSSTPAAPTGLTANTAPTFQLVINNGVASSRPATVSATVVPPTRSRGAAEYRPYCTHIDVLRRTANASLLFG